MHNILRDPCPIDCNAPGPWWVGRDGKPDPDRPESTALGAFWPLEWRLVAQWADLFARIDMLDHEHPGFMIEEHWQFVKDTD